MLVHFEKREELAPDIWQYYFSTERPLDYTPGQYVDFHLLQSLADPRGIMRTFSIVSIPNEQTISFAVKCVVPLSPYKQALGLLMPGDTLRVDDAMGDVVLPKSPETPLIFVAGGLGIASFVSILRNLEHTNEKRTIRLFYARHTQDDNPFSKLIESFPFTEKYEYISPRHLNIGTLSSIVTPDSLIYLSGSERFVEGLRGSLESAGIDHEQIIFDFFDGYTDL